MVNLSIHVLVLMTSPLVQLDALRHCPDTASLKTALCLLCSRFGVVSHLDILDAGQAGGDQALCFLRMQTAEQERRLIDALGVGRFGGDIVVIVDLQARRAASAANHSDWMDLPDSPPMRSRRA